MITICQNRVNLSTINKKFSSKEPTTLKFSRELIESDIQKYKELKAQNTFDEINIGLIVKYLKKLLSN